MSTQEDNARALAAAVNEIDELRSERDQLVYMVDKTKRQLDLANADYADLRADFETLGRENSALRVDLDDALEALEDIDTRLDVALSKPTVTSRPRRPSQSESQHSQNPLVSILTSPITKSLVGQLVKAAASSTRSAPAGVDGRAGDVEGTSQTTPSPARHPDVLAPEVDLARTTDPSGASQEDDA